jgi:hypothetical protein
MPSARRTHSVTAVARIFDRSGRRSPNKLVDRLDPDLTTEPKGGTRE